MKRIISRRTTTLAGLALAATTAIAACSSSDDAPSASPPPAAEGGTDAPATPDAGGTDSATPPDASTPAPARLFAFDPAKGQLPEGLVIAPDGRAFVGFAPSGEVVALDLAKTPIEAKPFAKLPTPVANMGFVTGLALDAEKRLYGALVSFTPEVQAGIYRAPATGGDATLFASDPGMVFPNGLAVRADGSLLVTDSAAGAVFAISAAGTVTPWVTSDLLKGKKDFCGPDLNTFDIGANGIALGANAAYVVNNDRGSVIRVPIVAGGAAGIPEVLVEPNCAVLGGADGVVLAADGSLYVAVNRQDRVVRVGADKKLSVVSEGGVLDFPASLAVRGTSLVVTSFALGRAQAGKDPKPALVSLHLP